MSSLTTILSSLSSVFCGAAGAGLVLAMRASSASSAAVLCFTTGPAAPGVVGFCVVGELLADAGRTVCGSTVFGRWKLAKISESERLLLLVVVGEAEGDG